MNILLTAATTLVSGLIAALLALATDRWRGDRARRQAGRLALQEFQRVLADRSSYMVITGASLDETPLEEVTLEDVAAARRAAYAFHDLLAVEDRELVTRNSIPQDRYDRSPIDSRQPEIDQWGMELQDAINRAFHPSWIRPRRGFGDRPPKLVPRLCPRR